MLYSRTARKSRIFYYPQSLFSKLIPPPRIVPMAREGLEENAVFHRKAGVDISGISDQLSLHNPNSESKFKECIKFRIFKELPFKMALFIF